MGELLVQEAMKLVNEAHKRNEIRKALLARYIPQYDCLKAAPSQEDDDRLQDLLEGLSMGDPSESYRDVYGNHTMFIEDGEDEHEQEEVVDP